ncbi:hypothetical protein PHYPSEUDO_007804 [Phytophthora pseudosyringae]|uniref:Sfi1 spindle body domain-containing protein n=1 Tax=Phytophthora pseudosyringae TaxID=221518 RepID=A0A8T1VIR2_9STRA|nr:hypothetical protein PHYPSEUDO_007804 [Phytophthora pseudosyringae]
MAQDEGEACVYVKESVLRELEQERRRLKWQLSRALQTSDSRAAQLEASKAKVKDLLTIVEMNKGVADQVVQRSHGRDAARRAELETLHQQNKQQRQRHVALAVRSMGRRVRHRQQRDAFHSLRQAVSLQTRRREALLRLHARVRRRTLGRGLERWRRLLCHVHEAGEVYSIAVEVVRDDNTQQLQLLRDVWRNWERVVRWGRRHRELAKVASGRLVRSVLLAWRSRVRIQRLRRVLLRRILARTRRRLQQLGLFCFRLRCAEVAAHDWAEVLKAAHVAMEEERALRAQVQSSAASELYAAYAREQQRQQRFTERQTQRLADFKRRECKHRALTRLRCHVIQSRQKNAIALRFQRLQHRHRMTRRLFAAWKREARRSRRTTRLIATWDARRTHSTKAVCLRLFAWTLQRRRQRRFRLRALVAKLRRAWLLRGWLCLRIRSAIEEHKAIAHVEMWQFSQHAEAMHASCVEDGRRSRRVALKYQVTCALVMADQKHEKLLRRVFRSWSRGASTNARRRRALKRLLARRQLSALRGAVRRWVHLNEDKTARCSLLHRYHLTRRHRAVGVAFDMWKRSTHKRLRVRLASYQQRSCFRAWRHWHDLRQQRARWFGRLLQRSMEKWRRQAFHSWKLKSDHYVNVCARRDAAAHELVSRLWRRWVGFVAFRLHQQRCQQQRALRGVRRSLHRTILSTAFASWRTNARHRQSRDTLVVRAFRRNAGQSRAWRYLLAWRRHSELTVRRRAALKRICQRRSLRRLRRRWSHWIRASMGATIAMLENSSTKAQQQVDSVARSTSRINRLRRTIQRWRRVGAEAKRQQRRRALFAEKRRYTMLQASLRQWYRKITCCSLTKQHRALQHLLRRLQLSLERQAFRLWERRAHAKTLYQRDRISAELFRRSETRVMALAEEIRAGRERRTVFASWRSITARTKKACRCFQSIVLKRQHRFMQNSWAKWTRNTQTQRCVVRLTAIFAQRLKLAAWRKLMQMHRHHDLRSTGARWAGVIWHKLLLRHAWNHWKRIDSFVAKHTALAKAKASSLQSMRAFKQTIARRHHKKHVSALVLAAWRQHVSCTKRLRRHLCDALGRLANATIAYHWQRWRSIVERQNCLQVLLHRVVKRRQSREVRAALDRWTRWTLAMAHRQQLERTQRALLQQREVSAKRIAVVKFLSWQRPCLEAHFARWKVHVEQRRRYVVQQREALTHRRTRHLLRSAWCSWEDLVQHAKRRAHLLTKTLSKARIALLARGFDRWGRWSGWMQDVDDSLTQLVGIRELWQRRRGFSALRQHHHEVIRRQSIMAASAFSAHSARQRERQTQMLRGVALVLQRKTSAALCDRCFRYWVLYVKAKVKTRSTVRLARIRSQKRMVRGCFIEWQRHTQQKAVLSQKLRRRQETWQLRRRRRIWNAWVGFTQHSLDVKHSIYDKLVICALRHSLQGAWGRWKAYTRHANALIDAHRVAQWEHATAERDKVIGTLEDKHERLLLRAAQLGQLSSALRQRLVSSAARKIHRVLELGLKSRVSTAFEVWKHKLLQVSVLRSRVAALGLRYQRIALQRWQSTSSYLRAAEEVKRVRLDTTEWAARVVHTCATQWIKRRTFQSWKSIARVHRGITRHVAVATRRRELQLVRCCWGSWKAILDTRARQHEAATSLQARKGLKTVLQAYWQWRSVRERSGLAKRNAIRTLVLLRRVWQHRLVLNGWNRWLNFTTEGNAATVHTKLVLVEHELEKTAGRYALLRAFSNWKMYAQSQYERRNGHTRALAAWSRQRLLRRHFERWNCRIAWSQARLMLVRRMERHLRRHYMTLTKFAVWVWFARVQAGSRTLLCLTTQLQVASKQFTPSTDVPARIARALLTDLLLSERQLLQWQQRSAWRLVNATVRNARRRMLRTAFDRLASGAAVSAKRRFLTPMHVANSRAFVDRMALVLLRSGFQRWRRQCLALAIQEAEEAQQELLRALHHVTSYRQALGPYVQHS